MVVTGISHKAPYSEWRDDRCKKQRVRPANTYWVLSCDQGVMIQDEKDVQNSTTRESM